jgi:hypothetical protein
VHSATLIVPSCNYCGNPAHKPNECKIPFKDLFCDYCGKEEHQEAICFNKFPKQKELRPEKEKTNTTLSTCEAQIYSQQEKRCISNRISNINKFNKMIISVTNIWHT